MVNSSVMKIDVSPDWDEVGRLCVGRLLKASRDLTFCHWVIIPTVCVDITMADLYAVILYAVGPHNKDAGQIHWLRCAGGFFTDRRNGLDYLRI
jgi:hypothetical protein